jgi:MFS family permease
LTNLHYKILLRVGTVIFLFAFFMTSLCTEYYQLFLAQGLLLGVGLSIALSPAFSAVPRHFVKHRGIALGICVAGSSLGGVIWPIVFSRVFLEVGFPWGVRIGAFIMLPLMGLACLTIKWPKAQAGMPKVEPDFGVLRNPVLITFAFAEFFVFLGLFTPFFYITSYSVHIGLGSSISFYMISIINASSLFGRILSGVVADRFGFFNILMLCVLFSGVICMCLTTATSLGGVVVLSLAYGLTSGVNSNA